MPYFVGQNGSVVNLVARPSRTDLRQVHVVQRKCADELLGRFRQPSSPFSTARRDPRAVVRQTQDAKSQGTHSCHHPLFPRSACSRRIRRLGYS
jgi:hypothetical protein